LEETDSKNSGWQEYLTGNRQSGKRQARLIQAGRKIQETGRQE
jgi:hypothetical protein